MRANPLQRQWPVLAAGLLVLASCGGEAAAARDDSGTVTAAGPLSVFDLQSGDCLMPAPDLSGEVDSIPVVPCDEPHTQEVLAVVDHPDGPFPGAAALAQWADTACLAQLQAVLGASPADGFFVSYLLPSFDSWNKEDDREVTCVLVFPTEGGVTGSLVRDRQQGPSPSSTVADAPTTTAGV